MIEQTKARLDQARSLLSKLQEEKFRQVQQASPTASAEFLLLFDNFIMTARSVTWVLQSEEREKYDAWKSSRGATLSAAERTIFDLVTKMRNSTAKRGNPDIEARRESVEIPESPHQGGLVRPTSADLRP